jgi:hypothetical protein
MIVRNESDGSVVMITQTITPSWPGCSPRIGATGSSRGRGLTSR